MTWNLFLITTGSIIQAIGFKAMASAHGFVPSGLFGVASLMEYKSGMLNAAFVASVSVEYCLSLFNQRKLCLVISGGNAEIADKVMDKLKVGATFLEGEGAYMKGPLRVLMVVTNNIQLKRLEEIVFTLDPHALFIVENTFAVIGSTFSKRKMY